MRRLPLLFAIVAATAGEELPKGQIIDRVVCARDSAQSYALYIPSGYIPSKAAPIIFCFDPAARGRLAVEQFQAAAERSGYIVAGSHNSRNGSWEGSLAAARAMIGDAGERLQLDPRRLYAAGFSGGARVASGLALGGADIAGVVICGAGFPTLRAPLKELPFAVFAAAGLEDFNYREIRTLERDLTAIRAPHKSATFPGGHDWAPPEVLAGALDWLDLQAVRGKSLSRNESWLRDLYSRRLQASQSLDALPRLEELLSLRADFDNLLDTTALGPPIAALEGSKEVKSARRDEALWAGREADWLNRIAPLSDQPNRTDYRDELNTLRRKSDKLPDTSERRMARRLLSGEFIRHIESGRQFLADKRFAEAASRFGLAAEVRPDDPGVVYAQARALALAGDRKGALKVLTQAVARGFRDANRLDQEPAFGPLRTVPAYRELLEKMRQK